jgi:hypothetical protein
MAHRSPNNLAVFWFNRCYGISADIYRSTFFYSVDIIFIVVLIRAFELDSVHISLHFTKHIILCHIVYHCFEFNTEDTDYQTWRSLGCYKRNRFSRISDHFSCHCDEIQTYGLPNLPTIAFASLYFCAMLYGQPWNEDGKKTAQPTVTHFKICNVF